MEAKRTLCGAEDIQGKECPAITYRAEKIKDLLTKNAELTGKLETVKTDYDALYEHSSAAKLLTYLLRMLEGGKKLEAAEQQVKELREALDFYSGPDHWESNKGEYAREALTNTEQKK